MDVQQPVQQPNEPAGQRSRQGEEPMYATHSEMLTHSRLKAATAQDIWERGMQLVMHLLQ